MQFMKQKEGLMNLEKSTVDYKIRVMRDAHLLATSVFPRQIAELDELLRSLKTSTSRVPSRRNLLKNQHYAFGPFAPTQPSYTAMPNYSTIVPHLSMFKTCLVTFWDNSDVISLHTQIGPLVQNMADHCILVRSWMVYLCSSKDSPLELRTTLQVRF